MKDIYDIKNIVLWLPIHIPYSIIFIIFLLLLYVIYYYLSKKKDTKIDLKIEKKEEIEKKDFIAMLSKIKEENINDSSENFYKKLAEILREILEEKWYKNITKMTFNQIKKIDLNNNIRGIIENIYYKEYIKNINDNKLLRLEYIEEIKLLIH